MSVARIYGGDVNGGIANTDLFIDGSALFMVCPDIVDELELDFYLQVMIGSDNRLLKLNPEYRMDTVSIYPIPEELRGANLTMYGILLSTVSIAVEVYVIFKETDIESRLQDILDEIINLREEFRLETIREIASDAIFALSEQQVNFGLSILASSLAPITAGVSATAVPLFSGSTGLLAPISIGGLL